VTETPKVPQHVVDGARHVLAEDGLAAATLERISVAAGVSRMTLHRCGLTKRDILDALAERLEADYREALWPVLVSKGNARERLRRALEIECGVAEDNLEVLEALSSAAHGAVYHDAGRGAMTRPVFVEPFERLLLDGAADGSLEVRDAAETATVLFNLVGHTYRHLRTGHGWTPKRARGAVVAIAIEGVAARG
jgi:AcrR family transcriptional regulator